MITIDNPLVSIGIPVYNEGQFLEHTLKSIIEIDYPNLEIIIVDNASTDRASAIAANFAKHDHRINYARENENRGAIHSLNTTFERARGKYFLWSGGHDLWRPDILRLCIPILEQDTNTILAFPKTTFIDEEGAEIRSDTFANLDTRGLNQISRYGKLLWHLRSCSILHGVWRRSVLPSQAPLPSMLSCDDLLLSRMALRGAFASVPEAEWFRREVHRNQSNSDQTKRRIKDLNLNPSEQNQSLFKVHLVLATQEIHAPLSRIRFTLLTCLIFAARNIGRTGFVRKIPRPWKELLLRLAEVISKG